MKKSSLLITFLLALVSIATEAQTNTDATVCTAIRNYLLGRPGAAILTAGAKQDITESTWPEVQCSVNGSLNSPKSFKNLTVKRVGVGKYRYSCVCPTHGDKFTDFCTISAAIGKDGKIYITHVIWDEGSTLSFSDLMSTAKWKNTTCNFKIPDFFTPSGSVFVENAASTCYCWTYDDICVACWPLLGAWATTDYPDAKRYLTQDVQIKNVTYHNSKHTVYSGYTTDGRIWYMKKNINDSGATYHADVLVLLFPKSKHTDVKPLIDMVKNW